MSCGSGETPLHEAARDGDVDVILSLLEEAPDQDRHSALLASETSEGDTPLHLAALEAHAEAAIALLQQASSTSERRRMLHAQNRNGCTPLHHAARKGSTDCVGALMHYAPTKDDRTRMISAMDSSGNTPIRVATDAPTRQALQRPNQSLGTVSHHQATLIEKFAKARIEALAKVLKLEEALQAAVAEKDHLQARVKVAEKDLETLTATGSKMMEEKQQACTMVKTLEEALAAADQASVISEFEVASVVSAVGQRSESVVSEFEVASVVSGAGQGSDEAWLLLSLEDGGGGPGGEWTHEEGSGGEGRPAAGGQRD